MELSRLKNFVWSVPGVALITLVSCDPGKPAVDPKESSSPSPSSEKSGLSSALGSPSPAEVAPAPPKTPSASSEPSAEETAKTVAALQEIDSTLRDKSLPPAEAGLKMAKLASDASVPVASRTDALQHAMNLLPDQDFSSLDGMLKNKETPVALLDIVFNEVHNRPAATQLPVALTLLHSPDPDVATRARSLLAFHLDRDYGDDFAAWDAPVAEALAKLNQGSPSK